MAARVMQLTNSGTVNLIQYKVHLPEYASNPLLHNMSHYYRANRWERVLDRHGLRLSTLGFNYKSLSLKLLSFGVEEMPLDLYDAPQGCFSRLSELAKVERVRDILMNDFAFDGDRPDWHPGEDALCVGFLQEGSAGRAEVKRQCCSWINKRIDCKFETNDTIRFTYYIITILKVIFIFFGPLIVQKLFFRTSSSGVGFVVHLKEVLTKTLLLKKIRTGDSNIHSKSSQRKHMKEFYKFRQIVKHVPSDEVVAVNFKKIHIRVPCQELVAVNECRVGLVRLLFDGVFGCGMARQEPLASCCAERIFGTWSKHFLWFKLLDGFECNRSCRKFCSWAHIFKLLGSILLIALLVAPYILRSAAFYAFEKNEMQRRKDTTNKLDLSPDYSHDNVCSSG
jgi:hypothetical protein